MERAFRVRGVSVALERLRRGRALERGIGRILLRRLWFFRLACLAVPALLSFGHDGISLIVERFRSDAEGAIRAKRLQAAVPHRLRHLRARFADRGF